MISEGLISVIVPVYNLENLIAGTLDSIFAQTYRRLEVIAVDDGSTDASLSVLEEYAAHEPRLRVMHKENAGVSRARNAGIAEAKGEYIGFCDGDDIIESGMYEHLLDNLLKYDADISHCGMRVDGINGSVRYYHNTAKLLVHSHDEGLKELLKGDLVEPACVTKLYRRHLFEGVGFDPEIRINEDLLINVSLFLKASKTVFEDVCPYHYIRRSESASQAVNDWRVFQPLEVREKILELCSGESGEVRDTAMAIYLNANVFTHRFLQEDEAVAYKKHSYLYRNNLKANRGRLHLLPRSSRWHAYVIIYVPFASRLLHRIFKWIKRK